MPEPDTDPVCYLGIDPGTQRTGYAVLQSHGKNVVLREGGVIKSDSASTLGLRISEIANGLRDVITEFKPRAAAIEEVFTHVRNPKTSITMAHTRGGILMVLAEEEVPVTEYSPATVKKLLTGSGKASKEQMQHAVRQELKLERILEPNDVADAAAIAVCLFHSLKFG